MKILGKLSITVEIYLVKKDYLHFLIFLYSFCYVLFFFKQKVKSGIVSSSGGNICEYFEVLT